MSGELIGLNGARAKDPRARLPLATFLVPGRMGARSWSALPAHGNKALGARTQSGPIDLWPSVAPELAHLNLKQARMSLDRSLGRHQMESK